MKSIFSLIPLVFITLKINAQQSILAYAGNSGKETFYDITQITDGTFLVCGYADNLDWLPTEVSPVFLTYQNSIPNSQGTNKYGFILQLSSDLGEVLSCVSFPQGVVEDIRFLKTNSLPYSPIDDLFISCTTNDTDNNNGGYIIAKLNGNFIDNAPTACEWTNIVWAKGLAKEAHPWDVTSNGEVYYVSGEAHGYDWSAIYCLDATGQRKVVENWRTHWLTQGGEWKGTPASSYAGSGSIKYSGMALKIWGRCELRSWTQEEFDAILPDGNGRTKKGTWPADFLFNGPCDPQSPTANGPGYNGYTAEACCPVWGASSLVVDRRNNHVYLGMNFKSYFNFPGGGGSPDFEPAVIAFGPDGELLWWSRLYHEVDEFGNPIESLPDQYVDALAIDYNNDMIVVGARCHGNNVENLWEGNEIYSNSDANGFQNRFTGTFGDIHISWIGKLTLANGDLFHSTYMAELFEGTTNYGPPHADPNLDGFPDPNQGWPDVNTTRMAKNSLECNTSGMPVVVSSGRRTITTANAFQKMVKPQFGGVSAWNQFVRVYESDLEKPVYSSLVVGEWDTLTQAGGSNTELFGVYKTWDGVLCVGRQTATNGTAIGNNIPVANVPEWGANEPMGETAIIAYYRSPELEVLSDVILNTKEEKGLLEISVFPNPAKDRINVRSLKMGSNYEILNMQGKVVLSGGYNGREISLTTLPSGVYVLKVDDKSIKIIVAR